MAADITNTSPRVRAKYRLILLDKTGTPNTSSSFSLHEAERSRRFDLSTEGVVHESHSYRLFLHSTVALTYDEIALSVNGEEVREFSLAEPEVEEVAGIATPDTLEEGFLYRLAPRYGDAYFFRMTFGFALIELDLDGEGQEHLSLATSDIACLCDNQDQEAVVSRMLDELAFDAHGEAVRWMLLPGQEARDGFALIESDQLMDGSQSLKAFLALCEEVVRVYEANRAFFRSGAHSRVLKHEEVVDARAVRRFGRRELQWLARTPDALYETRQQTAISYGGRSYMATRVQTERSHRSYDTIENRAVIAFIEEVARALGEVEDSLRRHTADLEDLAARLHGLHEGEGMLSALVVIDACLSKERPYVARADALQRQARRLARYLSDVIVGVTPVRYRLPRRSKVFQEIQPYAEIHRCMRGWEDFGGFTLLRDGFALQTWKMDKLYEYYVLYRLLSELEGAGFALDAAYDRPAQQVSYSLRSRFYSNEKQVANVYHLVRGSERVTLFYEPVVYGNDREENGIALHRLSRTTYGRDSTWTPDYVLRWSQGGEVRYFIFDAKFRRVRAVRQGVGEGESCFDQAMVKYKAAMASSDGGRIEAVWLLCGRVTDPIFAPFQASEWAVEQWGLTPDGVATVAPGADVLGEVLGVLGLL